VSCRAGRQVGRVERVILAGRGDVPEGPGQDRIVEGSRAYRDRLVLKLQGVDGPTQPTA